MERRTAALSRRLKHSIYALVTLLWVSGTIWFYGQFHFDIHDMESIWRVLQVFLLRAHGAIAMGFLVLIGILLPLHISRGWNQKVNRFSGSSVFLSCAVLIVTGWGLYYSGSQKMRDITSLIHTYLGLILPVIIFFHVLAAKAHIKRQAKEQQARVAALKHSAEGTPPL